MVREEVVHEDGEFSRPPTETMTGYISTEGRSFNGMTEGYDYNGGMLVAFDGDDIPASCASGATESTPTATSSQMAALEARPAPPFSLLGFDRACPEPRPLVRTQFVSDRRSSHSSPGPRFAARLRSL